MNLKSFHLVFISCAIVLAFLLGAWVLSNPSFTGLPRLAGGLGSFLVALGLIAYEVWFLRYSRRNR